MSENLNHRPQSTDVEEEAPPQNDVVEASIVDLLPDEDNGSTDNERSEFTMPYSDPKTPDELIRELHHCTSRNKAKDHLQLLAKQMRAQILLFKRRFPCQDEDYYNHLNIVDELESFIHKLRLPLSDRLQEVLKRADHRVRVINRALDDSVFSDAIIPAIKPVFAL